MNDSQIRSPLLEAVEAAIRLFEVCTLLDESLHNHDVALRTPLCCFARWLSRWAGDGREPPVRQAMGSPSNSSLTRDSHSVPCRRFSMRACRTRLCCFARWLSRSGCKVFLEEGVERPQALVHDTLEQVAEIIVEARGVFEHGVRMSRWPLRGSVSPAFPPLSRATLSSKIAIVPHSFFACAFGVGAKAHAFGARRCTTM